MQTAAVTASNHDRAWPCSQRYSAHKRVAPAASASASGFTVVDAWITTGVDAADDVRELLDRVDVLQFVDGRDGAIAVNMEADDQGRDRQRAEQCRDVAPPGPARVKIRR